MQGKLGARIDILFVAEPILFNNKKMCDEKVAKGLYESLKACLHEHNDNLILDRKDRTGRLSFMLLKGHDKVHQTIELP